MLSYYSNQSLGPVNLSLIVFIISPVGSIPKCLEFLPRSSFQGNCLQSNDLNQRPSIKCGSASPAKSQPLDDVIDPVIPRGSLRDSLEIEASFLQREEELLSSWWREYAECSDKLLYKIQRWCTIWTRCGGFMLGGPVGVDRLLTTKWILNGSGQVVDGDKAISYTQRPNYLICNFC
ncbi:putative LRR receptor-like protein kinase [Trifolium pratense]|uniref:Putative LRR receptor-like protein kinase n=1 Tax=Trifolium pratense TaxID=57577 RepID=A0A2K3N122_TRIPR|nr:putative LRR receptor-like protein kinase [Trifolium pratense]